MVLVQASYAINKFALLHVHFEFQNQVIHGRHLRLLRMKKTENMLSW